MMKNYSVLGNYSHYLEFIEKIANSNPYKKLTIEKLGISKRIIKRGYQDIHKLDFPNSLIDFICWISFDFFLQLLKKIWDKKRKEKEIFFELLTIVHENDYKNSKRLLASKPGLLIFSLKRMSFSSVKDRWDFRNWIKSLF